MVDHGLEAKANDRKPVASNLHNRNRRHADTHVRGQNLREAHELCDEQWLRDDLAEAKGHGVPLWDGKAKLRARLALPDEIALFAEAKNSGEPSDGLVLVYLVELGDAPP